MKHEEIQTIENIVMVKIVDLVLDPLNPRQDHKVEAVQELKESIAKIGLIQPLAGIERGNQTGIVAGGTRLVALKELLGEAKIGFDAVPVALAKDEAQALEWATAENFVRTDLTPYQEIMAYKKMADADYAVEDVAKAYGKTEFHIKRRLKLAALPSVILNALKKDEITLDAAIAFTVAPTVKAAKEVLKRLLDENDYDIRGTSSIKTALLNRPVYGSDRLVKFLGIDAYIEAGGKTSEDLFPEREGQETIIENRDLLMKLANEKFQSVADAMKEEEGFAFVETIAETRFDFYCLDEKYEILHAEPKPLNKRDQASYDKLEEMCSYELTDKQEARLEALEMKRAGEFTAEQKSVSGVYAFINHQGLFETSRVFVRQQDFKEARRLGVIQTKVKEAKPNDTGSTYSNALSQDLSRLDALALQTALLEHPALLLDMLAYSFSNHVDRSFNAFAVTTTPESHTPTKPEGSIVDERLASFDDSSAWEAPKVEVQPKDFASYRKLKDETRSAHLTNALARLVQTQYQDKDFNDSVKKLVKPDLRAVWTPNAENFFKRVKGDILNDIHSEIMDAEDAGFASMKKGEKVTALEAIFNDEETQSHLNQSQLKRVKAWTPKTS